MFLLFGLAISWALPLYVWQIDYANASEPPVKGLIEDHRGWFIYKEFDVGKVKVWAIQLIQAKPARADEKPLKEVIEDYIRITADKYGLHYGIFRGVALCESRLNPKAKGDWSSELKEHLAYGIFQFHYPTFFKFSLDYGKPELEYENPFHQIELAGWAFANDLAPHWKNCLKHARKLHGR